MTEIELPSTTVDGVAPSEPDRLMLPAEVVGDLIMIAIRSQEGNAWWRGFVAGHGFPAWVVEGKWRLATGDCAILPGGAEPMGGGRNGAAQKRG